MPDTAAPGAKAKSWFFICAVVAACCVLFNVALFWFKLDAVLPVWVIEVLGYSSGVAMIPSVLGTVVSGVIWWTLRDSAKRRALAGAVAQPSGPSPGWYPDPNDAAAVRYFDGGGWTSQTHPRE